MTLQQQLANAHALLRRRRFAEAEVICRSVFERTPGDPAALHLLGLIRKDAGDVAEGERLLRRSIELAPRRAEFRTNLANLLRRQGRLREAEQSYHQALALDCEHHPARLGLARTLNDLGRHSAAEAQCRLLIAANDRDPQAWSALAMALRDQQRLAEAEAAYRQAIAVAPDHAAAYHNLGALLAQMERAEEALAHLDRACALGIQGRELAFNRGRVLTQLCRLEEAERAYADAVALDPRDAEAHLNLARLRYMRGDPKFARDIAAAAAAHRDDVRLQMRFGDVLRRTGDLAGAEILLRDLLGRCGPLPEIRSALATVLQEAGRLEEAEMHALQAAAATPADTAIVENVVAILLCRGRPEQAAPFIRAQRTREPHEQRWIAYEASAARLRGDARYRELCDYDRLVRVYDLEAPPGRGSIEELNAELLETLSARHPFAMHPFDQSLRNGSQTARSLLIDPSPAIRAVLQAFAAPLEDYRQSIGAAAGHPLSERNRAPAVLAGCWSVQLRREGFHVNHIHPQGWISSAYYVGVPAEVQDEDLKSGWLKFGEPRFPVPGAGPERLVQPRAGRLVLFPSYLWHGTNPIHGGEPRTTIAFDAIPGPSGTS